SGWRRSASPSPGPASAWTEYTLELQRHGLEQVEREVRWLDDLIDHERSNRGARPQGDGHPAATRTNAVEDDSIVAAQPPQKERG
ncbi:hypothetical protein JS562_52665, partial [Agrobacterium sp. S2]|nr:hypothetical protein [Agrobacterium sp. S2]